MITKDQYYQFVKDSFREIFGSKYNDKIAEESATSILLESDNDPEKAKAAAEVIIARTKAKVDASKEKQFDSKPSIEVNLGGKKVEICPKTGAVMIDGKPQDYKVDLKAPLSDTYAMIAKKLGVENKPEKGRMNLHDSLDEVKQMLNNAPAEIKKSFNDILNYLKKSAEKKEFCDK